LEKTRKSLSLGGKDGERLGKKGLGAVRTKRGGFCQGKKGFQTNNERDSENCLLKGGAAGKGTKDIFFLRYRVGGSWVTAFGEKETPDGGLQWIPRIDFETK